MPEEQDEQNLTLDKRQRAFTLRMFTIAVSISLLGVLGVFLKSLGVIYTSKGHK